MKLEKLVDEFVKEPDFTKKYNLYEKTKAIYEEEGQTKEKKAITKNLLKTSLTNAEIAESTGLSVEELELLKEKNEG